MNRRSIVKLLSFFLIFPNKEKFDINKSLKHIDQNLKNTTEYNTQSFIIAKDPTTLTQDDFIVIKNWKNRDILKISF